MGGPISLVHPAGSSVKAVTTIDGAHAAPIVHQQLGDAAIVPAKLAGTFGANP